MTTRVIWGALLAGQVMFFVVILVLLRGPGEPTIDRDFLRLLFMVSAGMLIVAVPTAFLIRRVVLGGGETIAKERFATGHILFMGVLEGVSMFGLVLILLSRELWPYGAVPAAAFVVQVVAGFPSGDRLEGMD